MSLLFPKALDDDSDLKEVLSSEDEEDEALKARKRRNRGGVSTAFNRDFHFGDTDPAPVTDHFDGIKPFLKKCVASSLQEKIDSERRKLNLENKEILGGAIGGDEVDLVQEFTNTSDTVREKTLKNKKTADSSDFFDSDSKKLTETVADLTFYDMKLSRPLLKAIMDIGYTEPTAIQSACIPVALAGKDVCACSATGTGKTAAFMLPILERLLYRPKGQRSVTRVLVLVPTRELAIQVFQVSRKLAQFTNVEICLCAGGLDLKSQEAALRLGLDIVIATPGRLIDHLHNSPNFSLLDVEVLVLDEADRMLDDQFADQMKEIIRLCSKTRQTMLFSATMTDEIEDLVKMSLNKPARLFVNENTDTADNLRQEFIRIREGREADREAVVAALTTRNFPDHTIVFVRTKRECQRLNVVLGMLGVHAGQLHGGLSQSQRIHALTAFKAEQLDVLVCTDLASRGLDIEGVQTVINMHMPASVKPYVHRVGRTARAGKSGRAISLIGEDDRKLLKLIYKQNEGKSLKIRNVLPEVLQSYSDRINSLSESVKQIEREEQEEKAARQAEDALAKVENKLNNKPDERDGRVWFQTKNERADEKRKLKQAQRALKLKEMAAKKTPEERSLEKTVAFQVRQAKREKRPKRMRVVDDEDDFPRKKSKTAAKSKKKSSFVGALTNVGNKAVKKIRYGPDDKSFNKAKKSKLASKQLKGPRK